MPVYQNSDELYSQLNRLFTQLQRDDPQLGTAVQRSRLAIRIRCTSPSALVLINGRSNPFQIQYGADGQRPDLDIEMPADILHDILMGSQSIKRAIASGSLRVRGPVWKTTALEDIFRRGQSLYPKIYQPGSRI